MQWFPRNLKWQLLYLLYRWLLALYFLCWFLVIAVNAANGIKWRFLIYISNWAFLVWVSYLVISAASLSVNFSSQLLRCNQRTGRASMGIERKGHSVDVCSCSKCQERRHHNLFWSCGGLLEKLQWITFTVGTEFAVAITILYWTLFYQPHSKQNFFSLDSLHVHLINGVLAVVDLWVAGVAVRVYHAIYPVLFAASYVAFTGVYYAAGGRDPMGNSFIYPFLNYKSSPGSAAGLGIICALILTTAIHFVFFLQFSLRNWITCTIQRKCYGKSVLCRKGLFITYNHLPEECTCTDLAL